MPLIMKKTVDGQPVKIRLTDGTLYADLPIGFILPSFEDVAPVGFLKLTDTEANRTVSRTTYKELFDWATAKGLIGTGKPFGVGDGSTTFVIPDGREIAFKGIGENSNGASHVKSGGLAVGEFVDDRVQSHEHGLGAFRSYDITGSDVGFNYNYGVNAVISSYNTVSQTGRTGDTTEVKALGCHYYIKAKNVGVPADFIKEVSKLNSYSTEEINTGTTWIDGKPIYRRAVQSSADIGTSSFSWAGVDSNIGANMDTCIKSYATYKNNGVTTTFDVRFFSTQGFMGIGSAINTGAYIILEYTKTTD